MRHHFFVLTVVLVVLWGVVSCGGSGTELAPPPPATAPPPATSFEPTRTEQATPSGRTEVFERTVHNEPFDDATRLFVKVTYTSRDGSCCSTVLQVLLIDRADATKQWEVDSIFNEYEL